LTIKPLQTCLAGRTGLTFDVAIQQVAYIRAQFVFGDCIILNIIVLDSLRGNFVCRDCSILD
jgi:hypothetical protein